MFCAPRPGPASAIVQIALYDNDLVVYSFPFIRLRAPWKRGPVFIFVSSGEWSRKWTLNEWVDEWVAFLFQWSHHSSPLQATHRHVRALLHDWISTLPKIECQGFVLIKHYFQVCHARKLGREIEKPYKNHIKPIFSVTEKGAIHKRTVSPNLSPESKQISTNRKLLRMGSNNRTVFRKTESLESSVWSIM